MASGFALRISLPPRFNDLVIAQAVSGLGVFTSMTEIFTMMAAFCMLIYSILLFYNGSIEYLSSRIQPHP
jgi:hypothetical protein